MDIEICKRQAEIIKEALTDYRAKCLSHMNAITINKNGAEELYNSYAEKHLLSKQVFLTIVEKQICPE